MGVEPLRALLAAARMVVKRDPAMADRLRLHFIGTSNQTGGGEPRVLPHARELGVEALVREHPARLDYLDALDVLRQADAIALLGSAEPHYTPSKIFPALLANRPLLAIYHRESTAVDILSAAAPPPAARLITFDDQRPVGSVVACLAEALGALVLAPSSDVHINRHALEPWSARALAGRLAGVCDRLAP